MPDQSLASEAISAVALLAVFVIPFVIVYARDIREAWRDVKRDLR